MYIKKDEYKKTKHIFKDKYGKTIIIDSDTTDDEYIYNKNKYMFEVIEKSQLPEEIISLEKDELIIDTKEQEFIEDDEIKIEEIIAPSVDVDKTQKKKYNKKK